jgi:hypothetical protein
MLICGLLLLPLLFPSILLRLGVRPISAKSVKQYLDSLTRKDSLRGAETTEISVPLGNYSASHFDGSAVRVRRRRYRLRFPEWLHPSTPPPFAFTMLRRGLGPLLQLLGLGLTAVCLLAVYATTNFDLGLFLQLLFILLFAGVAWGGYQLRLLGVRAASSEAEQLLAQDPRPLVLYLRSFEDDESSQEEFDLPIFRLLLGRRDEDRLMRMISQFGPVIAVGRPGEWLPPAGAARLSVTAPDWRAEVERLCKQARIVVLRVGFTDGFWWEVRHVWERVPRDRILLWVPRTKRVIDTLERDREFAERFQAAYDVDLPLGRLHRFIYFTSNGVPISPPAPSFEPIFPPNPKRQKLVKQLNLLNKPF